MKGWKRYSIQVITKRDQRWLYLYQINLGQNDMRQRKLLYNDKRVYSSGRSITIAMHPVSEHMNI